MAKTLWKETLKLWLYTCINVPMLAWLRPRILVLNDQQCKVMIKLNRRTKNHVGSMYFGALCSGGELPAGLLAMNLIAKLKAKSIVVFKDVSVSFAKLSMADVYFTCTAGEVIKKTVTEAITSGERKNVTVEVIATTPDVTGDEPVAVFTLTLSVK